MPKSPPKPDDAEILSIETPDGTVPVRISSPTKPYFSAAAHLTKLDVARYFLSIAPAALNGIRARPIVLKRFVNGACLASDPTPIQPEPFYQKRAPSDLPPFLRTVTLSFPSGRTAEELVVDNAPGLLWMVNLGCIELHPHPVLASDLEHPNELRVDLDPNPGVEWPAVREVALIARDVLQEHGLTPFVKTSGSRGIHILVRIHPRWPFSEVRRAALALAREVERRAPAIASSKWWKEERHGVFLDYNQNAKDRTTASAYSVRPLPDARVSAPLQWDELPACSPADFTVLTMPARFATLGDPHAAIDQHPGSLDALLDLAARDEASGLGDAPWPPHFAKGEQEPKRVQPSKAKPPKAFSDQIGEGFGTKRFRKRSLPVQSGSSDALKATGFSPSDNPSHEEGASAPEGSTPKLSASNDSKGHDFSRAIEEGNGERASAPEELTPKLSAGNASKGHDFSRAIEEGNGEGASAPEGLTPKLSASNDSKGHDFSRAIEEGEREGASAPGEKPGPARKSRTPKHPLLTIAQSPDKAAALAGLDRWRAAHPIAASHLAADDILTDRMRGSAYLWYRIRVNLRHVPEPDRPTQQTPDPDEDPTRAWRA